MQPTTADDLLANLAALPADADPLLRDVLTDSVNRLVPVTPSDMMFTDDLAPVETLFDSLVLNFLLGEDLESLR
jgi:hypothetical protein